MPSLGKDLVTIREYLGLSIQDIQNATKLPLDTLKAIESGAIFKQKVENITYVRSFVRTYARNLKLNEELVNRALDQEEVGNYNHLLLSAFPELSKEKQPPKKIPESTDTEKKETVSDKSGDVKTDSPKSSSRIIADFPDEEDKPEKDPTEVASPKSTISGSVKSKPLPQSEASVRSVNWADMGRKFVSNKRKTPVWVIGAAVIIITVLAVFYLLFQFDLFSQAEPEMDEPETAQPQSTPEINENGLILDLTDDPESLSEQQVPELKDTLFLTIYAANDRLEPVRIWSDLKPRIDPYWVEQGIALNFEFTDTIRVSGQYSRMLLFMNGHLIENFRQEYFIPEVSAVELTRSIFESDPEWAIEIPFELPLNVAPPDSVADRPSF